MTLVAKLIGDTGRLQLSRGDNHVAFRIDHPNMAVPAVQRLLEMSAGFTADEALQEIRKATSR